MWDYIDKLKTHILYKDIRRKIKMRKRVGERIVPRHRDRFRAFSVCPYNELKVVIIGQDPYHGYAFINNKEIPQANGMAFSVSPGVPIPPSLRNIYKELNNDGFSSSSEGQLDKWAQQGVLLLNTSLTTKAGTAGAHMEIWSEFTEQIIRHLVKHKKNLVFILWGNHAIGYSSLIKNHHIITSPHPSPFSANTGFFGSKPFSKTNDYLRENGIQVIDWNL